MRHKIVKMFTILWNEFMTMLISKDMDTPKNLFLFYILCIIFLIQTGYERRCLVWLRMIQPSKTCKLQTSTGWFETINNGQIPVLKGHKNKMCVTLALFSTVFVFRFFFVGHGFVFFLILRFLSASLVSSIPFYNIKM